MSKSTSLLSTLKEVFGFSSFRPLQEAIVRDALAGKDVFAVLPTGGGKSLCFQLPAVVRPGLTVVVSPLIALMKDQVDALAANGVAATFLNSSVPAEESRARWRGLCEGKYRLLYLAPERLMLSGVLEELPRWNVGMLAVDEAHCISEWGHDFRPEYRQLSELRARLPKTGVMALTATATERVRTDIIQELRLRSPAVYIASFNRPNLTYRVLPKDRPGQQVLDFVRRRPGDSGIVYCQSRKSTESLAERLVEAGIRAKPYHAGLSPADRTRHQELFLRDEARVMVATIAFGMGINKPNVRFVVHADLPKNLESYYQETGRAGRDGLPAECLLLFSAGDVAKQIKFLDEKSDPKEREIARAQLNEMVRFAESAGCRRRELLAHFGETFAPDHCGGCDNCLSPRETYDGTVAAQKFLSCVYRIRERSGFNLGLTHVVEVLTGADTEKVRKWGHDQLSTYGIGRETSRGEWMTIGRELLRRGLVQQAGEFHVITLTDQGLAALKQRTKVALTKPLVAPPTARPRTGEIECDEALFERLRLLRKKLADELTVPSYIVFSDVSLRHMARTCPTDRNAFAQIPGVGERKLKDFGEAFLAEIRKFLADRPAAEPCRRPPGNGGASRESGRPDARGR